MPQRLRIGICECAEQFFGVFRGQTVTVVPRGANTSRTFELVEITTSDRWQREDLRETGAHFLLQIHTSKPSRKARPQFETDLFQNFFASNGVGRGWRLYIGGSSPVVHKLRRVGFVTQRRVPSWRIIRGIQQLLERMDPLQLIRWAQTADDAVA